MRKASSAQTLSAHGSQILECVSRLRNLRDVRESNTFAGLRFSIGVFPSRSLPESHQFSSVFCDNRTELDEQLVFFLDAFTRVLEVKYLRLLVTLVAVSPTIVAHV